MESKNMTKNDEKLDMVESVLNVIADKMQLLHAGDAIIGEKTMKLITDRVFLFQKLIEGFRFRIIFENNPIFVHFITKEYKVAIYKSKRGIIETFCEVEISEEWYVELVDFYAKCLVGAKKNSNVYMLEGLQE
jgi:hypothetical protein